MKTFAEKTLPTLKEHQALAHEVNQVVAGERTRDDATATAGAAGSEHKR